MSPQGCHHRVRESTRDGLIKDQGMVTFEKLVKAIRKDVEEDKYIAWEKAYRGVMEKLSHSKRSYEYIPVQQERYEPNLSVVYEGF